MRNINSHLNRKNRIWPGPEYSELKILWSLMPNDIMYFLEISFFITRELLNGHVLSFA